MARLKDVAHEAGVSVATVSRVLNKADNVSSDARQRVENAVETLHYTRNRVARRLRTQDGKNKLIGLVVPDIQNPFYVDVVRGVEDVVFERGYAVIMCNFGQDEKREGLYVDIMRNESVDGLIIAPVHNRDDKVVGLVRDGLPIVCVDRGLSDANVDVVVVDNEKGAFDAVDLLLRLGHRRIAMIAGKPKIPTSKERERGYLEALRAHDVEVDPQLVRFGDSKHESGRQLAEELLGLPEPPTALFTGNNLITLGALETIHRRKLRIPDDIAVVGFDDMYWSISLNPPLTAVRQPGYEIGRRAADMLFQRIAKPDREHAKVVLSTELMVRRSCGSPEPPERTEQE